MPKKTTPAPECVYIDLPFSSREIAQQYELANLMQKNVQSLRDLAQTVFPRALVGEPRPEREITEYIIFTFLNHQMDLLDRAMEPVVEVLSGVADYAFSAEHGEEN